MEISVARRPKQESDPSGEGKRRVRRRVRVALSAEPGTRFLKNMFLVTPLVVSSPHASPPEIESILLFVGACVAVALLAGRVGLRRWSQSRGLDPQGVQPSLAGPALSWSRMTRRANRLVKVETLGLLPVDPASPGVPLPQLQVTSRRLPPLQVRSSTRRPIPGMVTPETLGLLTLGPVIAAAPEFMSPPVQASADMPTIRRLAAREPVAGMNVAPLPKLEQVVRPAPLESSPPKPADIAAVTPLGQQRPAELPKPAHALASQSLGSSNPEPSPSSTRPHPSERLPTAMQPVASSPKAVAGEPAALNPPVPPPNPANLLPTEIKRVARSQPARTQTLQIVVPRPSAPRAAPPHPPAVKPSVEKPAAASLPAAKEVPAAPTGSAALNPSLGTSAGSDAHVTFYTFDDLAPEVTEPPERPVLAAPSAASGTSLSPGAVSRPVSRNFRGQRISLAIPVLAYGHGSRAGAFREETRTVFVMARGAVIYLAAPVELEEEMILANQKTGEEVTCRVVSLSAGEKGKPQVEIEFTQSAPQFWRISFPPETWDPADRKRPEKAETSKAPGPPRVPTPV